MINKAKDNISAKDILEFLAIGGVLIAAVVAPNAIRAFRFLGKDANYISKKKFYQSHLSLYINRLQKQGAIKRQRKGNKIKFVLTEKGKRMAIGYSIKDIQLGKNRKWDGKWRMVIFDIPENKKAARDALSHKLKELGMRQLQKSVFVYPFECKKEIDLISDFWGVGEDILYLEADIKDVQRELKKEFGIF